MAITKRNRKGQVEFKYAGPAIDFFVQNEGSIFLLTPWTEAAREWIGEHIPEDAQRFGASVVVEHRYIMDLIDGVRGDGLTITGR